MNLWKYLKIGLAVLSATRKVTDLIETNKLDVSAVQAAVTPAITAAGLTIDPVFLDRIISFAVLVYAQQKRT